MDHTRAACFRKEDLTPENMREKKFKKGSEKEEERREKKLKKEVRKRRTCSSALLLQCVLLKTGRTPPIDNFYICHDSF